MLIKLLPVLRELGAKPEVLVTQAKGSMAEVLFDQTGIATEQFRIRGLVHAPDILRLARHFRERQFDVVHSHMVCSNIPGTIAARLAGIPCIVGHLHNTAKHSSGGERVLDRLTLPMRDATLCVSDGVRRFHARALHVPSNRFRILYNAVDPADAEGGWDRAKTRARLGCCDRDIVLIHVARLCRVKNQEGFLRAFPGMLEQGVDLRLWLVGDGRLEEHLRGVTEELGIGEKVQFLGFRTDVHELMHAADIQILPSFREGLSNVVLEGWQHGLPIVASGVPGIDELITDGKNGYLRPFSDMHAFGKAVLRLAEDANLRQRLGEAGRERVQDFLVHPMAEKTMELYEEVLRRKSKRKSKWRNPRGAPAGSKGVE